MGCLFGLEVLNYLPLLLGNLKGYLGVLVLLVVVVAIC